MAFPPFRLRELPLAVRAGMGFSLLALLGGFAASGAHLRFHHSGRDDQPGLSLDDLRGAYHGTAAAAPLVAALERDHPPELGAADRTALLAWLRGGRISEDFDNPELGDAAPGEVISRSCVRCHTRRTREAGGIGERLPLDYWDDVKKAAFVRDIRPTPVSVLAASTHTHALALSVLTLVLSGLALLTSWPARLVHGAVFLLGFSLFADLAGWWLARGAEAFVWVVVVAGGVFNGLAVAVAAGILLDLWLPRRPS